MSCRAPADLRFALAARGFFPPLRLAGLLADFERAVRTMDLFRPGWTRAFFDKVKTYCENLLGRHTRAGHRARMAPHTK
jgi:hypothetical protein